jgi:hypothetical protein
MRKPPAFIIVLATLLGLTSAQGEEAKRPGGPSAATLQNPLAVHSLSELTATRERPLFSPTRRPPPPPAVAEAEPAPPPAPPPNLQFSGVVMDKKGALAIIRPNASAAAKYVRVGDVVSGWKVGQIERRQLILSLDGRSATFTLFDHAKQTEQQQPSPLASVSRPQTARVLEVNAAGVLRSHRVHTSRQ